MVSKSLLNMQLDRFFFFYIDVLLFVNDMGEFFSIKIVNIRLKLDGIFLLYFLLMLEFELVFEFSDIVLFDF